MTIPDPKAIRGQTVKFFYHNRTRQAKGTVSSLSYENSFGSWSWTYYVKTGGPKTRGHHISDRDIVEVVCLVEFCRKGCPTLPEDAEVLRASGACICSICNKPYREHPMYAYPTGAKHAVRDCDGTYLHL